jgi:hypothetical protein
MNPLIVVLGLISLFTDLSSNMIVPILPLYLTTVLHVQVGSIGIIEGIAESTASILKLFSGWFTDPKKKNPRSPFRKSSLILTIRSHVPVKAEK